MLEAIATIGEAIEREDLTSAKPLRLLRAATMAGRPMMPSQRSDASVITHSANR